ncbi:MAG: hypothetical protein ACHQWU_16250 [Gemmatimonadales bacterium]
MSKSRLINYFCCALCSAASSLSTTACSGSSGAAQDSTHRAPIPDTTASTVARSTAPARDSASGDFGRSGRDSASSASASSTPTTRTGPDSAILLQIATQPKARTKADSISLVAAIRTGLTTPGWPVKTPPLLARALLPAKRIVAFYGNPLSKKMGILGEIPYDQMLTKLDSVVASWRAADPSTPVLPALHLIVSVAQGTPGKDGMYRQRSDPDLIEKIYGMAHARGAITILDIQAGKSTIDSELPVILPFLQRPDVHLGLDPEFYMHYNREGRTPGSKIGAMDASDVNYAIDQLAALVTKYHLPPKVLIIHRFTTNMLQHVGQIKLDPRVQVVINMDGWGQPWLKFDTYARCEASEPVEYTGFKLFFHNDTRKGDRLLSPTEVLALRPRPVYIQYQ